MRWLWGAPARTLGLTPITDEDTVGSYRERLRSARLPMADTGEAAGGSVFVP